MEGYTDVVRELKTVSDVALSLQGRGFIVGFELQKELDPHIDDACKRILSTCTSLLTSQQEATKTDDWHDIQQRSLLSKSEWFNYVEEQRPTAATGFVTKYVELSSAFYCASVKSLFVRLSSSEKQLPPVLIGDPVEGDDAQAKSRRRSSFALFPFSSAPLKSPSNASTVVDPPAVAFDQIPAEAGRFLLDVLKREICFFREFFGPTFVRRKALLAKIMSKAFALLKSNLREVVHENGSCNVSLQMMAALTELELDAMAITDLSIPTQWINELQGVVYDNFKRLIKKQTESLASYPELKTSLTSSELHHHYVVRRFAVFMQNCLNTLKSFHRPWEIIHVELKKVEHVFYALMAKLSGYIRDRREGLIFQINNYDMVMMICGSVAGADFLASLSFKYETLTARLVRHEQETYLADLLLITESDSDAIRTKIPDQSVFVSTLNDRVSATMEAVAVALCDATIRDFSNIAVVEYVRAKFIEAVRELYEKYLERCRAWDGDYVLVETSAVVGILERVLAL